MNQRGISRLEYLAREMVEGTFGRLFGGRLEPLDVANQLAKAIEDDESGAQMPPNYRVSLNPDDLHFLTVDNPHLATDLAAAAQELGRRANIIGIDRPLVQLVADPQQKRRQVKITSQTYDNEQDAAQLTKTFKRGNQSVDHLQSLKDLDAFLIVQGRRHIPLNIPIITIGRRAENDIVLDIPSVSRKHAQIRWRYGHFILYDISSRGVTLVNGHPAHEHVLRPGDVITLSDALLVYGEGNDELSRERPDRIGDDETQARPSNRS